MASRSIRPAVDPDVLRARLHGLARRLRAETANGLRAEWELRLGDQVFAVTVAGHACAVHEGPASRPDTTISTQPETWLEIDEGRTTGPQAFLERRLDVTGNLDLAVRLQTLFRPYRRPRRPTDLDQVEVVADGVRLSCYVVGRGSPIVLLHGFAAAKISWVPLLRPLGDTHRVIVPDLPGHGESDKPVTLYSARYYARVIRHLLDATGVDRAVVVGNSMGGRIALELALRSPRRVAGLVLLDPAVPGLRWRYLLGFTRVFPTELGAIPFPLRQRWMERLLRNLFSDPSVLAPDAIPLAAREFIRIYREPSARVAFVSSLRHVITESPDGFWPAMRRVRQPALVIVGEDDRLVPPRLGVRLARTLPDAELLLMPKVGHVPQFEATDAVVERIRDFAARVSGPPAR